MTLCVMVLIASEFMPVSLLTPIAADLGVTEGQAGQAIAISGVFAVLTSLFIAAPAAHLDRRRVLLALDPVDDRLRRVAWRWRRITVLFMAGRALLGVAIGGFWSMSTATVMRLVPAAPCARGARDPQRRQRAGGHGGRAARQLPRRVYRLARRLLLRRAAGGATLVWQLVSLPPMPPRAPRRQPNVFRLLAGRAVAYGMAGDPLLFMGQFALFTYLRPFLETVTDVNVRPCCRSPAGHRRRWPRRQRGYRAGPRAAPRTRGHRHPARPWRRSRWL